MESLQEVALCWGWGTTDQAGRGAWPLGLRGLAEPLLPVGREMPPLSAYVTQCGWGCAEAIRAKSPRWGDCPGAAHRLSVAT